MVIIDLDSGQTLAVIGQPSLDMLRAERGLSPNDIRAYGEVPEEIEGRKLATSPDGRFAVATTAVRSQWTVGATGYAVFALDRGELVATLEGHKPYPRKPAFVCGGRPLVTASSDRTVRLWEVGTWRELDRIDIRPGADEPVAITARDAHDAFGLTAPTNSTRITSTSAAEWDTPLPAPMNTKPASSPNGAHQTSG